jgi:prepilin-type N-terminal cleavage/methylation domain-containing protein
VQAGFTLVELMVVVAIIGILAAIGVPQLTKYIKTAETSEAAGRLGDVGRNIQAYIDSKPNIANTLLQTELNAKVLHPSNTAGGALSLSNTISQLTIAANAKWSFRIEEILIDSTTRLATFCISARKIDATVGAVLYSSTLVNSASWDGNFHRGSYIQGSEPTTTIVPVVAGSGCTGTGIGLAATAHAAS